MSQGSGSWGPGDLLVEKKPSGSRFFSLPIATEKSMGKACFRASEEVESGMTPGARPRGQPHLVITFFKGKICLGPNGSKSDCPAKKVR